MPIYLGSNPPVTCRGGSRVLEKRCSSTSRRGQDSSGEKVGLQDIDFEKKFACTRKKKSKFALAIISVCFHLMFQTYV